jgi:hypothetical protein
MDLLPSGEKGKAVIKFRTTISSMANQHKGHPGLDIFIHDKNQDSLDDETGKPVEVIAAVSGIVASVNLNWEPSSPIRGGNYIWIYDPINPFIELIKAIQE